MCLGKIAVALGTASVNLFIALNQLSGLSGGFQADKLFGMISMSCTYTYGEWGISEPHVWPTSILPFAIFIG